DRPVSVLGRDRQSDQRSLRPERRRQAAKQSITVDATDLSGLIFAAGNGPGGIGSSDLVWVRASDSLGFFGPWQSFTIGAPNDVPVVTGINANLGPGTPASRPHPCSRPATPTATLRSSTICGTTTPRSVRRTTTPIRT